MTTEMALYERILFICFELSDLRFAPLHELYDAIATVSRFLPGLTEPDVIF